MNKKSSGVQEPSEGIAALQSTSDARPMHVMKLPENHSGEKLSSVHGPSQNNAIQSGQRDTSGNQSRDMGGYNSNTCQPRGTYDVKNQNPTDQNRNQQSFGASNQNFSSSSSNQYDKSWNKTNVSGYQNDRFGQSDKFTTQRGGHSAYTCSSHQGGPSSLEQTCGQGLQNEIELFKPTTYSHALTAGDFHSRVEQSMLTGDIQQDRTKQQLNPSVKQLFDIARPIQVEQQQSLVQERPSHDEGGPIDLSDLPPLEPDEYFQFMDEHYPRQFSKEAALSPLPQLEPRSNPASMEDIIRSFPIQTLVAQSTPSDQPSPKFPQLSQKSNFCYEKRDDLNSSNVINKSPVNLVDYGPVVGLNKLSHKVRQPIISPSPASCVSPR